MVKSVKGFAPAKMQEQFAPQYSDEEIALKFAAQHSNEVRYVAKWNKWHIWDGKVWIEDEKRKVYTLARKLCRESSQDALLMAGNKDPKLAREVASARKRAAVVTLAGEDPTIAATTDQWDTDRMLLNTQDGILDLKTGELLPHNPEKYMTKITACGISKKATCPKWLAFLNRITKNDAELISYIQRAFGYSLTGIIDEHAMWFAWGPGRNGKSTLYNVFGEMLGDYHEVAPMEALTETKGERHPTELAKLRGARYVTAIETEEGVSWSETKIKALTGGDEINARFMRQDFFTYKPQFKLHVVGNHKPSLRTVDEAIKARFNLVPFDVVIPEQERNLNLSDELKEEWPGILRWSVEGCLLWQKMKLQPPKAVRDATADYLSSENSFGTWIEEECDLTDSNCRTASNLLFEAWKKWAMDRNLAARNSKWFKQRLEAIGLLWGRGDNSNGFVGIKFRLRGGVQSPGADGRGVM
jgi:putative DNA primase/helicase